MDKEIAGLETMKDEDLLGRVGFASTLSPGARLELLRKGRVLEFEEGATILALPEGEGALWLVIEGAVKRRFTDTQGRLAVLPYLTAGDIFGYTSSACGAFGGTYVAARRTRMLRMPRMVVERVGQKHPAVALAIAEAGATQAMRLQGWLAGFMGRPAEERLVRVLLDLAAKIGEPEGRGYTIRDVSHRELSELIGTSREMVSTLFRRFREEELLRNDRRVVFIKDLDRLAGEVPGPGVNAPNAA